jgi:hypothetical protein
MFKIIILVLQVTQSDKILSFNLRYPYSATMLFGQPTPSHPQIRLHVC